MKVNQDRINHAVDYLVSYPAGRTTLTTPELRKLLLDTDGKTFAQGRLYRFVSKRLGAGVLEVRLEEWK